MSKLPSHETIKKSIDRFNEAGRLEKLGGVTALKKHWMSPAPEKCDVCETPITTVFYDMKTKQGPWGCLCPSCAMLGPGIGKTGLGFGQKYELQDGKFYKTEG